MQLPSIYIIITPALNEYSRILLEQWTGISLMDLIGTNVYLFRCQQISRESGQS